MITALQVTINGRSRIPLRPFKAYTRIYVMPALRGSPAHRTFVELDAIKLPK